MAKQKLELTWIGKDKRPKLEPRILLEDQEKSYHAKFRVKSGKPDSREDAKARRKEEKDSDSFASFAASRENEVGDIFDNMQIFGDNLLALKALEQEFTCKVKCVFIDPPYNTGSAFTHYDDGLEHSIWLSLMRDRLEIIRRLLADDGSLWITIDDNEAHYLKVLCDEVFGRSNFVANLAWHKRVSPANDAKYFSGDFDHILVFTKQKDSWRPNRLEKNESQLANYRNPDGDHRGSWNSAAYTCAKTAEERPNLYYPILNPNTGEEIWPSRTRVWAYDPNTHAKNAEKGLVYWGKDGKAKMPRIKKFLTETKPVVPRAIWSYDEAGHNQESRIEIDKLFPGDPFTTPKPERLLKRVLEIATNPGDLVLDSFAGSGTTGAVAHKMGRRWIMIERANTAIPTSSRVCRKSSMAKTRGASARPWTGRVAVGSATITLPPRCWKKTAGATGSLIKNTTRPC